MKTIKTTKRGYTMSRAALAQRRDAAHNRATGDPDKRFVPVRIYKKFKDILEYGYGSVNAGLEELTKNLRFS